MPAEKKTHFGRAGEFFAMSEILLRGWNVAVPVVDVGDDVFVIDDNDKRTRRVQVKSTSWTNDKGRKRASFALSRSQLLTEQVTELFFMLLLRDESRWMYLIIPRVELLQIRTAFLSLEKRGRGRPPLTDSAATTDTLLLTIEGDGLRAWNASLVQYVNNWPPELAVITGGPGSTASTAPVSPSAEESAPTPDPER